MISKKNQWVAGFIVSVDSFMNTPEELKNDSLMEYFDFTLTAFSYVHIFSFRKKRKQTFFEYSVYLEFRTGIVNQCIIPKNA